MEPAASTPRGALPRKRRRSQSPPPAGEGPVEPALARPRFGDNLDLILSLQGKELPLKRKIELAFNFITTESNRSSYGHRVDNIQLSRMVSFIGNWVQSILILPEKKVSESFDPVLDYRCWVILRFCIEKKPSVSISLNLLKTLGRVAKHGLSRVNVTACGDNESFELFKQVLECMSFLFSANTRAFFNASVDLWTFCIIEAINVVQKDSPNEKNECTVLQDFANCLLEQFSSFLRFYANPKNIFRTFVDKILDPLLELLVLLNSQANSIKHKQAGTTLKIVEEILSNGLFHPQHLSGYFGLKNLNKASIAKDVRGSYHRHLFERFKGIKVETKAVLLAGFGNLLQLFVSRARSQTTSLAPRGTSFKSPQNSSEGSEEPQHHRESLFEVFVQFMEPLVLECKSYSQKDFSRVTKLVEVHCMLKSINEILTTVIKEKLYVPTEDTSEGSYLQFLQDIYMVLILMSEKLYDFWVSAVCSEDTNVKKMLPLMFVEIVVAVGHFVEIEYKVMGDDLVKLWSMIFALSAINASSKDIKPCFLLTSKISSLSAQVIHTFSELRQVAHSICMLCNSVRTFSAVAGPDVVPGPFSVASLSSHKCLESLATLLSSQTLRDAICTSINSMPEGQSSRCIEEMTVDLTDTLKWMESCSEDVDLESQGKSRSSARKSVFNQKAELFGRHLSELYSNVLDSITVTPSNTTLVAKSVERLVNAIRPNLTQLVRNESINLSEFIRSVVGKNLSDKQCVNWQKISSLSWLFVFFFRIYASCRSLYRQCVGLMPPDLAIEATELMGISFTVCCGNEWTNTANVIAEGYFAWIVESSGSLLNGIEILSQSIPTNHSGLTMLVYILHVMALQRLNDLNRQINVFDFLLEEDTHQFDKEARGNTELLKESCCLEAARLTNFMMSYMRILSSGENSHFGCYEISSSRDLSICSLDEGSFPVATWQLLCENIDIWSSHASKKDLKNFFSNLIRFSFVQKRSCKDEENSSCQYSYREITLHTISVELLCDAIIYDRKVLLKNLTSSFCHALKKSASSFVTRDDEDNALLDISPDLMEILNKLDSEKLLGTYPDATHAHMVDKYRICENLLKFFSTAPGFHSNSKSFLRLITYILHLERLLLLALLSRRDESCNPIELICLFVCCRRAMKNLVLKFGEGYPESKQYSAFSKLVGNSYSLIWLLSSVQEIVGLSHKIFEADPDQKKKTLFSLVDTTSEIFSILANMNSRFCLFGPEKKIRSSLKHSPSESNTSEHDGQTFDVLESSAFEYVKTMAEQLEKTTTGIPITVNGRNCVIKIENCYSTVCWDKLLCTMSCIGGFLWGLISALESTIKDYPVSSSEERKSMLQYASSFSISIAKFETFVDICLHVLFMENKGCEFVDLMSARLPQELECENGFLNIDVVMDGCTMHETKDNGLQSDVLPSIPSENHYVGPFNIRCMKESLLENLLNGEGPFVAFTLRELYSVSAAIAKLKGLLSFPSGVCRQARNPFEQLSVGPMIGTAYIALQKIADMSNWPDMYSLVWIDGILRYLEVIGTLPKHSLSKELYAQIVNAHMRAIGKCILLQAKSATLPTHEIGSSTKTLHLKNTSGYVTRNVIDRQNIITSLKSRLRLSMRKFVNVTSNMHLSATLQVIERALVGVNQYSHSIYEVKTGTFDGGTVSSDVAAGIDCLYLVLESVPGNKRVFKRTIPDLVGALFNIVLHLQSPFIFYMEKLPPLYPGFHPDAGAVVLMCVEVITAFVGRHTLQINACHVSQCLHLPVTLFKGFKHLLAGRSGSCSSEISRGQTVGQPVESKEYILDRQFSIDMYAACCKLLCTALRHQQREVGRCVAVLEDSVNILLSCLESSDTKKVSLAGYFAWNKEEAIKCASFFRRIYEEMRQQREALGKHSMHFLAGYISMFSGQGPFQTGITREIDEALRPGVYSLIDICEESDFQQLHTYLGEGPCRATLANLVHDYKLHFQYQGKI
ncbi:uncharacterized protein LOC100832613 [Brachypodium distachyon]|nr:uncharacterized protein LOC100832613 [Brachypodium distachyon]|eukprot:XP_010229010.1 uncharacterized protein LOC100832613 [Brachypodium distachyon]